MNANVADGLTNVETARAWKAWQGTLAGTVPYATSVAAEAPD